MKSGSELRRAVVLSGGSVYAAYEVGVLKALLSGESPATGLRPFDPEVYVGSSGGSVNAALMMSRPDGDPVAAVDFLKEVWLNELGGGEPSECRPGAVRMRGDVTRFLNPTCLSTDPILPLYRLTEDAAALLQFGLSRTAEFFSSRGASLGRRLLQFIDVNAIISIDIFTQVIYNRIDLKRLRSSAKSLRIATTNWRTGELRLFGNDEMSDEIGHDVVRASARLPGIAPVFIEGDPYVDGAYVLDKPISPAIAAGADEMHVVFMDPDIRNIPIQRIENLLDVIDKYYHITQATIFKREINGASDINRGLQLLERRDVESPISANDARALLRTTEFVRKARGDARMPRMLTIHLYHPREDLGGILGLMNFDRTHILDLVAKGYADAVAHDCVASGCVLPNGGVGRAGYQPSRTAFGTTSGTNATNGGTDA
jgi:predicted acylesterase/phospholipase RssA